MAQETGTKLTALEATLAAWSAKLEWLTSRLSEAAAEHRLELEHEVAEIRAARDDVTRRLETSKLGREEREAEGLRLLVEDIAKRVEACAKRLGVED